MKSPSPAKIIIVAGFSIGLLLLGYFQGYVHGTTTAVSGELKGMLADASQHSANIDARLQHLRGAVKQHVGQLDIVVKEKPFGMHVRRGSLVVEEVFPGFPAEKVGVRAGCQVQEIAGEKVKEGTWLETFQKSPAPFKMAFNCPPQVGNGHGPMSVDNHNYRVMVVKKPFGMNIQVNAKGNVVPRVVEVLPGSAAEAAGVKRGFVLTAIQDQAVDAETWFDAWQKVTLPCTLSFDASIPAHDSNLHFKESNGSASAPANLPEDWEEDKPITGFHDVSVLVKELPFGMEVDSPPGKLPIVKSVTAGRPAEAQGIKAGDVLFKVAGHRVDSSSWFGQFQHSVPPFGLKFRRPEHTDLSKGSRVPLPLMPVVGELEVMVEARPFGMSVHRGSHTVKEVFPGSPAQKLRIRKGCDIRQIAGKNVSQGTWMDLIQHTPLPFSLKLFCGKITSSSKTSPALSQDEHNFKVLVKERPFGMNVQVNSQGNGVPRVVEVLPGYPAEKAGVKAGFVLTAINDQPVSADTWLDIWHHSSVGTILTFDTNMAMHESNSHMVDDAKQKHEHLPSDDDVKEGFSDFRCAVEKLPFGFEISAAQGGRPTVKKVMNGTPAEAAGVRVGDVLIEVSGLPVHTGSWFKAFQQAAPPFGLHFRRPAAKEGADAGNAQGAGAEATNNASLKL